MIGDKLSELRTQKGYTLKQMGEVLGVSHMTYQRYEKNDTDVSTDMLAKIADFYQVSTDYLLGRTTVREMAEVGKNEPTDEEVVDLENKIVDAYTAMSLETRRKCMEMFLQLSGSVCLPDIGAFTPEQTEEFFRSLTG